MKKTNADLIKKYWKLIEKHIVKQFDGWLWFGINMISNAMYLFFIMMFVKAFFIFTFQYHGTVDADKLEVVTVVLWAIGIIYLVFKIPIQRNK
ncbi:MAG: hypothetical protein IH934_04760 [Nanoarchaeota archaeon]|nr:hypothetical protein [Nanoarchaeota archaeon]